MQECRLFLVVLNAELKRLFAYRVQFWFELIASSIVELIVALTVWTAVFRALQTNIVGTYSLNEMILYITAATFSAHAIKGTGMGTFSRDIYEGSYTRYLIYPISILSYKFAVFFARTVIAIGQLLVALCAVILLDLAELNTFSLSSSLLCLLCIALASYLYFLFIICVESIAFWADSAWALAFMVQVCVLFFSGKMIPLDLFPDWFSSILQFTPFPSMVFAPVQLLLGKSTNALPIILLLIFWILVFSAFSKFLISRGNLRYAGVGI